MPTVSLPGRALAGLTTLDRLALACIVVTSWHKLAWSPLGRITLSDLLQLLFVAATVLDRVRSRNARVPAITPVLLAIGGAFLCIYLAGSWNLDTNVALSQWVKGMFKWSIHFAFLIALVTHLVVRGERLLRLAVAALVASYLVNGVYGAAQVMAQAGAGVNLDKAVIHPFFNGTTAGGLNYYGRVTGTDAFGGTASSSIYRVTALMNDPNHLGGLLSIPLMLVLALALVSTRGPLLRLRPLLGALAAAFFLLQLATQSRSGLLGCAAGLLVIGIALNRRLLTRGLLTPLAVVGVAAAGALVYERSYVVKVVQSRLNTTTGGSKTHTAIYQLIGPVLDSHPALGLGLNNFAVYYAFRTGRTDFGPHSFYVSTLTETGIIGGAAYVLFIVFIAERIRRIIRAGRERAHHPADDGFALGLGWGLAAALAAMLADNVFYLTMIFDSWYVLAALAIAGASILATARAGTVPARARPSPRAAPASSS